MEAIGEEGGFGDESSSLCLLCTLFQLHLRSSAIRFRRLGTPVLQKPPNASCLEGWCVCVYVKPEQLLSMAVSSSLTICVFLSQKAYIRSNQTMGWGEKAIEIRSVETGHLDGVFMHKRAQRLKFLCERNDKVTVSLGILFRCYFSAVVYFPWSSVKPFLGMVIDF